MRISAHPATLASAVIALTLGVSAPALAGGGLDELPPELRPRELKARVLVRDLYEPEPAEHGYRVPSEVKERYWLRKKLRYTRKLPVYFGDSQVTFRAKLPLKRKSLVKLEVLF